MVAQQMFSNALEENLCRASWNLIYLHLYTHDGIELGLLRD